MMTSIVCFEENKWRFNTEEILHHAARAGVPMVLQHEISEFLAYAHKNQDIMYDLWHYYYVLFMSEELIIPLAKVKEIPTSYIAESKYPGLFSTVIFLAAARHFEEYIQKHDFYAAKYDFMESYYRNIRRFMDMNYARNNTYALIRYGEYLYGYAKPLILHIGRFSYELRPYENQVCTIYEKDSRRIFIVNEQCQFDKYGYPIPRGSEETVNFQFENKKPRIMGENGLVTQLDSDICLDGWQQILKPNDFVVTIHIPGSDKLLQKTMEESFIDAVPILKKAFKDYAPKKLVCTSWLLSPQLSDILDSKSNILRFQSYFDRIGWYEHENAIYEHIFHTSKCPLEKLVPKNRFQESILRMYHEGQKLHTGFGILKDEWQI